MYIYIYVYSHAGGDSGLVRLLQDAGGLREAEGGLDAARVLYVCVYIYIYIYIYIFIYIFMYICIYV